MKYPRINREKIDSMSKRRFDVMFKQAKEQIEFDATENEFNLSKKDIELLAWNLATRFITFV